MIEVLENSLKRVRRVFLMFKNEIKDYKKKKEGDYQLDLISIFYEFCREISLLLSRILRSRGIEVIYPKEIFQKAYFQALVDEKEVWDYILEDIKQEYYPKIRVDKKELNKRIIGYLPLFQKTITRLKKLINNYRIS